MSNMPKTGVGNRVDMSAASTTAAPRHRHRPRPGSRPHRLSDRAIDDRLFGLRIAGHAPPGERILGGDPGTPLAAGLALTGGIDVKALGIDVAAGVVEAGRREVGAQPQFI